MPRIVITGGCGFIGSSLAAGLIRKGCFVTVVDNLSRRGSELNLSRLSAMGAEFSKGDTCDRTALDRLTGDFTCLIDCSAEPSVLSGAVGDGARSLLDVNLLGAVNSFEWSRRRGVPVIYFSSSRVYPYDRLNACRYRETETRFEFIDGCSGVTRDGVSVGMPLEGVRSLYGASKLSADLILREYALQYGLPSIIDRCGVVAGPWQMAREDQGVFTFWVARHYFRLPLQYIGFGGNGRQVRGLLHIDDLVDLVLRQVAALRDRPSDFRGDVYNAGGSVHSSLSLREATEICRRLTGHEIAVSSRLDHRPSDMIWYVTDNGDTGKMFGWAPRRTSEVILQDTLGWIKDNEHFLREVFL